MNNLYVIGMGPGSLEQMSGQAVAAVKKSSVIFGYTVYVELLKAYFPEKEYRSTPMRQEKERCELALKTAQEGKTTAVICSGDAGVYGMAGLIYELGTGYDGVEIVIVPGITAALAGGAILGAPLMHDFAVISLSDLMTPWVRIEKRLRSAAEGDFVICLYNPSSHKRKDYLKKACDILLESAAPETVCGYVRNIGRDKEYREILSLEELKNSSVDMFTTVFIGNSQTVKLGNKMVTPRGYLL